MKVSDRLDLDFVLPAAEPRARMEWCEVEIKDQPEGWRARHGYGKTCQRRAHFIVNGRKLCRVHAGTAVLDALLADHPTHFYRLSNQPAVQVKPGVVQARDAEQKPSE